MKLIDLIDALATEIESVRPLLNEQLAALQSLSVEDDAFMDALDGYTDQVTRMGEASEMAGFPGLQAAASHVLENTLLLATLDEQDEREDMLAFMTLWPECVVHYLRHLDDPSCAAGLVDLLRAAPVPMEEDKALRVMHQLGAMYLQVNEGAAIASDEPQRAEQATAEDVALEVPGDVDQKLMEGFYNEAPGHARELVELVSRMAAGESQEGDLTAAKRIVHTLKGSGAIIGLRGLASLGHHFEDVLEHFERREGVVATPVANALLDSAWCLEQMVDYVMGADEYPAQAQAVLQTVLDIANRIDRGEDLSDIVGAESAGAASTPPAASADAVPAVEMPAAEVPTAEVPTVAAPVLEPVTETAVTAPAPAAPVPEMPAAITPAATPSAAADRELLASAERELTHIPPPPKKPAAQRAQVGSAASTGMRVATHRIEELFRVSAEVSVHTAAMEAQIKALTDASKVLLEQNLRVKRRLLELETVVDVRALNMMRGRLRHGQTVTQTETQTAADAVVSSGGSSVTVDAASDTQADFDPLEMDQYNELHSTAHALAEDSNDAMVLSQNVEEGIAQLQAMQNRQQVLARDLQHLVMTTRMAEVGTLEPRLQRNVRNTCQITGKKARLALYGEGTLIDSELLSRLAEPLLHVLRNAVDHGIELPADRLAAGKSETGLVVLDFSRQGQQVVLRCSDDGRGLDYQKIYNRALERKLIDESRTYTNDELAQMILQSGFSTRDVVSEVSGRGVGMDVVRDWVSAINGSIRVRSVPGRGSVVELRFAASLSTVQSLVVEVQDQRFALPSVHIVQAVAADEGEYTHALGRLQYRNKEQVIPASRLSKLLGLPDDSDELPLQECATVLMRTPDGLRALAVDRLVDSRELLVKSLDRYSRHVEAVSGTSILGDGSIAVHIDVPALMETMPLTNVTAQRIHALSRRGSRRDNLPKVLVVDDSLAVRNTLQELVEDAGYAAVTARDGLDAIEMLRKNDPRVVLTDLEMPNMNGVELTRHLRAREEYKSLPVIMVTSRSQEKHRLLASDAGVDKYMTKPYNEGDLLAAIRSYMVMATQ